MEIMIMFPDFSNLYVSKKLSKWTQTLLLKKLVLYRESFFRIYSFMKYLSTYYVQCILTRICRILRDESDIGPAIVELVLQ